MEARTTFAALLTGLTLALVGCPGGGTNPPPPASDFALKLGAPSANAFQGAGGLLRVTLERRNGFAGEVVIGLQNPPEGVTASTTTLKRGTQAQLAINLASSVPVGALGIVVVGTSGAQTATASMTLDVKAATASAQELIRRALAAGRIDLGTSLVYRAYALFGDGRLPPEFVGSGSEEEDNALFLEIEANRASLSPAALDLLRPYTVRPNDPASAWSAGAGALRPASVQDSQCEDEDPRGWATNLSGLHPVRVWAYCPGDEEGNRGASAELLVVLDVLDRVYGPMTALMGPPVPDETGDSAIDFYIVPPAVNAPRSGGTYDVQPLRGVAISAPPRTPTTTSGYVMLPTWRVREDDFMLTVIHEFFHVLQFAHSALIVGQDFWFTEASATWASFHFNRTVPVAPRRSANLHLERFGGYQGSFESLLSTRNSHNYFSYIWPLFMEHKSDKSLIGEAWRRLGGARTPAQGTNALDGLLSFKDHFRDFAVRNLNDEFLPGDPLPRDKRYVGLEKDPFPDRQLRPRNRKDLNLAPGTDAVLELPQPLEPLSAGYFRVDAAPDPKLKQVKFDLEGLRQSGLDVDALVKIGGTWESKPRDLNGKGELEFCLDRPDEKLETIWFVLSNHQKAPDAKVFAGLRAKGLEAPCESSYSGTSSSIIADYAPTYRIEAQVKWVLQPQLSTDQKLWFKPEGTVTFEALPRQDNCTLTISPSTQPIPADTTSHLAVDFSTSPPTFEGAAATLWAATYTQVCPEGTLSFTAGAGGAWFLGNGPTSPDGKEIRGPFTGSGQTFNFSFRRD